MRGMSPCFVLISFWRSYSLTVFSPSGKLVQIEHALAAVSSGTTSLGIKGTSVSSAVVLVPDVVQHQTASLSRPRRSPHPSSSTIPSSRRSRSSAQTSESFTPEWAQISEFSSQERVRAHRRTGRCTGSTHQRRCLRRRSRISCSRQHIRGA